MYEQLARQLLGAMLIMYREHDVVSPADFTTFMEVVMAVGLYELGIETDDGMFEMLCAEAMAWLNPPSEEGMFNLN